MAEREKHIGAYPDINPPILLAYAFRVFFWAMPFYLALVTVLWTLVYLGVVPLPMNDLLVWHVYELVFGVAIGAIGAFILTAIPEFFIGTMPIVGRDLAKIVVLWLIGRISFWFIDLIGVLPVMLINIAFLLVIIVLISKPVLLDKKRVHLGLYLIITSLAVVQILFFLSLMKMVDFEPMALLKFAITILMALELAALRRIFVGVGNMVLELQNSSEVFFTRPYRYNLAIFAVLLYGVIELFAPSSAVLGWIGLSIFAFTIAIFNDFFLEDTHLFKSSIVFFLSTATILIAIGFGFMGILHLIKAPHLIETARHILGMGVVGTSIYAVMVVVGFVHTGRDIAVSKPMIAGFVVLLVAIYLRIATPFAGYSLWLFVISAILYSVPFLWYLKWFGKILLSPRADGLKG